MKVIRGISALQSPVPRAVVTIGNFDGVHIGHQEIMRQVVEKARQLAGTSVAFTFRPHPQIALRPEQQISLLTTYDEKAELLGAQGIDLVIEQPFSREFSITSPDQFFHEVLIRRLNARAVVVGYDFAFGKGRAGSLEALQGFCERSGVELTIVPAMRVKLPDGTEEVASSSRVRQALQAGEIEKASALLGRPYFLKGVVVRGDGRGRKIGYPTANVQVPAEKLMLPLGVYATRARVGDQIWMSATSIGVRPTFKDATPGVFVESHLLDFDADLYGGPLELRFVHRLRPELKFESVEKLTAQIALDVQGARQRLA